MEYCRFTDKDADRFLRYAKDPAIMFDGEDVVQLLQQAKRANALAEAVQQVNTLFPASSEVLRALAAYRGEDGE